MSRILILTQTYVPDPSATGQHMHSAATALVDRGHSVCVLAANRGYEESSRRYRAREVRDGVDIRRLPLSSFGKASIAVRIAGGLSLVVQSIVRGLFLRKFNLILVSTSPPLCPIAALVLSWLRSTPIFYWIHDLNPDQTIELGIMRKDASLVRLMDWLQRLILRRARRIVVLDRFMDDRIQRKLDVMSKTAIIPPWPHNDHVDDIQHIDNPWRREHVREGCYLVMHSGNHSLVHPLNTLLQAALRVQDDDNLVFFFVGGGLGKQQIEATIKQERCQNVRSLPFQPLEILHYSLAAADIHVVSVGDRMVGVSHPCKIYGAMAAGRPILLLGPDLCHATDIMQECDIGWHVAHGDVDGAVTVLRKIRNTSREQLSRMGRTAQELIRCRYSREVLRDRFCDELEAAL